ncbi:MAG: hypothetical protein Q8M03_02255 [Legionella sp.]|nr:hypothetical protein [Legionella sp.]
MVVDPKRRKREANRAHYEKTRDRHDAVLLRLDRGDLAKLDMARGPLGLSRSAFVKLHLLAASDALSARSAEIEAAMRARRISLSTFLASAIDAELARAPAEPGATQACAREFDELFAGESKGES